MARRNDIIDTFKSHLETTLINDVASVDKRYLYMDEINDFPAITFVARREARQHRGDGRKLATIRVDLRVYIYDRDINDLDLIVRKIEEQILVFKDLAAARALGVEECQTVTVDGDEGLMRPYQVGDMQILITYDVDTQYESP